MIKNQPITNSWCIKRLVALVAITLVSLTLFQTTLVSAQEVSDYTYTVTRGTMDSSMPAPSGGNSDINHHGFRFFCVPSHFSYDDPVVYPGEQGAAHAHMFFGNTDVNYLSTSDSIINSGGSSCDGGITNRSAYWVPAMFNENREIVLPKAINLYYKSWVNDRSTLQPIPQGLQILANDQVQGANTVVSNVNEELWQGTTRVSAHDGLSIEIRFPDCVAVDSNNEPILTSSGGTSHVAFSNGDGCPASHPYNIPQLTQIIYWDNIPFESDWKLASDLMTDAPKGTTAHADYMAGWTEESAQIMVDCVRDGYRECGPPLQEHADDQFYSPAGEQVYGQFVIVGDATPDALADWPHMLSNMNHSPDPVEEEVVTETEEDEVVTEEEEEEPSSKPEPKQKPIKDSVPKNNPTDLPKEKTVPASKTQEVTTTDNLAVRSTPGGEKVGKQLAGAAGKITDSTRVSVNGYKWVYVDFEISPDGYVADEFLKDTSTANKYVTTSTEEIAKLISSLLAQIAQLQELLDKIKAEEQ